MRWRPFTWFILSGLFFVAAIFFWRMGNEWEAKKARQAAPSASRSQPSGSPAAPAPSAPLPSLRLLNLPGLPQSAQATGEKSNPANRFAHRLTNTTQPMAQLKRNNHAILLENALIDTSDSSPLAITAHLRVQGDPGSYIVQSRAPLDDAFRAQLKEAGAAIVSYIPNNAYLVRASAAAAQQLASLPQAPSVMPYEPYYKLKPSLLNLAVQQTPLPDDTRLNLLLFGDALSPTLDQLKQLGVEVVARDRSPFGPVLKVRPPASALVAMAALPGVQEIEYWRSRVRANDLSRQANGVALDSLGPVNYLGLTGTNVLVNVNDTGVDANHPDL